MSSCFLTQQGTLLCFGGEDAEFRHVELHRLDEATLVVTDADAADLRAGLLAGRPVALRPQTAARSGLPRTIGVGAAQRSATVSLEWRGTYLCAATSGDNVTYSDRVEAWEEFLAVPTGDVALLCDFSHRGWEIERGRPFAAHGIRLRPNFVLEAGGLSVDLRRQPTLGGEMARVAGRSTVLVEGWRIETLRRFEPLVVWRHDGSETADEEIVLGVRSMMAKAGYGGAVHVETRLGSADLHQRCGVGDGRFQISCPPEGRCGLLPWDRDLATAETARTPFLLLANGVTCHRSLDPLLRTLSTVDDVAVLPWLWTAEAAVDHGLFALDPAEAARALACSGAVVGLPDLHRSATIRRLVSAIAANQPSPSSGTEGFEDALLRYVVGRAGGATTDLLSAFVVTSHSAQAPADGQPTLINHRPYPAAVRADLMRAALGTSAG